MIGERIARSIRDYATESLGKITPHAGAAVDTLSQHKGRVIAGGLALGLAALMAEGAVREAQVAENTPNRHSLERFEASTRAIFGWGVALPLFFGGILLLRGPRTHFDKQVASRREAQGAVAESAKA